MKIQRRSKVAPQSLKRQNDAVAKYMAYGGDDLWANNVACLCLFLLTCKLVIMVPTFLGSVESNQRIPLKVP